jgi:transposase-like protein
MLVAHKIRNIFNAPDLNEVNRLLKETIEECCATSPTLANWADEKLTEGLA